MSCFAPPWPPRHRKIQSSASPGPPPDTVKHEVLCRRAPPDTVNYEVLRRPGSPNTVNYKVLRRLPPQDTIKYEVLCRPGPPDTVKYEVLRRPGPPDTVNYEAFGLKKLCSSWVCTFGVRGVAKNAILAPVDPAAKHGLRLLKLPKSALFASCLQRFSQIQASLEHGLRP